MRRLSGAIGLSVLLSLCSPRSPWFNSAARAADDIRGIALAELGGRFRRQPASRSAATTAPLDTPFQRVRDLGANWVAIDDFASMESVDDPHVYFGWGRGGSRDPARFLSRSRQAVMDAHALGLKVLIKPHIWSRDFWGEHKWNGDIGTGFETEADWDSWFKDYGDYILAQARMAEETGADALCVGVEYQGTSRQEARWRKLVAAVRAVYRGPLTYAATFLEWKNINWWDCLDCIGIDAYFPVAQSPSAPEAEIRAGWEKVLDEIEPVAARWHKGVCFLELGYTTWNLTGKEPWSYTKTPADPVYQARLYKVALEEIKTRPWLKGVFLWKWMANDRGWGEPRGQGEFSREPFAIQDKPLVLDALRAEWLEASRKSAEASGAK